MAKPSFVVPLSDLDRGPKSVVFSLDEAWLRATLAEAEATPNGPGTASVEISKSGRDVMVRGRAEAKVTMSCVVTLDPIEIELRPEIFLMLSPREPSLEGSGRRAQPKRRGEGAPKGKKGRSEDDSESELSNEDAAQDTFEGSQIELDSFFREFLLLELPLFPRRSDLPSTEGPAIAPPSADPAESADIDPRLKPLADLRSRISQKHDKSKE